MKTLTLFKRILYVFHNPINSYKEITLQKPIYAPILKQARILSKCSICIQGIIIKWLTLTNPSAKHKMCEILTESWETCLKWQVLPCGARTPCITMSGKGVPQCTNHKTSKKKMTIFCLREKNPKVSSS